MDIVNQRFRHGGLALDSGPINPLGFVRAAQPGQAGLGDGSTTIDLHRCRKVIVTPLPASSTGPPVRP